MRLFIKNLFESLSSTYFWHRQKHRLSYRMLFLILLCSSFFTLLGTGLQLYLDYRSDVSKIHEAFGLVESSYVQPLSVSLWNFDRKQIDFQVYGLLSLPDVQYVEVNERNEGELSRVKSAGTKEGKNVLSHTFPLQYQQGNKVIPIGSLLVVANLNNIYDRLQNKLVLILSTQMVKTFFVSLIILLIFQIHIIRHLNAVAEHMEDIQPDGLKHLFKLNKSSIRTRRWPDALDRLVSSINDMKLNFSRFIDEQFKAEIRIRNLRNYLQNVIDSMPSMLIGVDSSGKIVRWNKKVETVTGVSADDAKGKYYYDFFPQLKNEEETVNRVIEKRSLRKHEKVAWRKANDVQYVNILIYPLETGNTTEAVIMIEDVTEQVRMEELMIQTEKMMSIGGLAAGMAHEINNPLGGILQGAQNITRRLTADLKVNQEAARKHGICFDDVKAYVKERSITEFLDGIQQAGERAARIITNMMAFSRPGNLEKNPVNIERLLDNTTELVSNDYDLKKRYDFKHIRVKRDYDSSPKPVFCIESEIEQVIYNLLKNAAQAFACIEKKEAPLVLIRTRYETNMITIEIMDNGPGMDSDVQRRVFEPFFTTKPPGEGTGLGLSVSYMIVTSIHSGTMEVRSDPGVGTTFMIRLPCN